MMNTALPGCARVSNFQIYSAYDYGVYFQARSNLELVDVDIVDTYTAIYAMRTGTSSKAKVSITNCNLVGQSSSFSCSKHIMDTKTVNIKNSGNGRGLGTTSKSMIGIVLSMFLRNLAPALSFSGIMDNPKPNGLLSIKGESSRF